MLPRPREATPTDTTLHYTTLFRCGVCGRAATLAEDLPLVGEADDVLDGEEEGLVPELGDQRQFVFDLFHDLRGCTLGPAPAHAGFGELAQMRSRRFALRHQLGRVVVFHLAQVEGAAPCQFDRGGQRSEEHTSELQSLMRISYAVFCLKKKQNIRHKIK